MMDCTDVYIDLTVSVWVQPYSVLCRNTELCISPASPAGDVTPIKVMTFPSYVSCISPEGIPWSGCSYDIPMSNVAKFPQPLFGLEEIQGSGSDTKNETQCRQSKQQLLTGELQSGNRSFQRHTTDWRLGLQFTHTHADAHTSACFWYV